MAVQFISNKTKIVHSMVHWDALLTSLWLKRFRFVVWFFSNWLLPFPSTIIIHFLSSSITYFMHIFIRSKCMGVWVHVKRTIDCAVKAIYVDVAAQLLCAASSIRKKDRIVCSWVCAFLIANCRQFIEVSETNASTTTARPDICCNRFFDDSRAACRRHHRPANILCAAIIL